MVQPAIFVRKVVPSDVRFMNEATKVVNAAYRSEGNRNPKKEKIDCIDIK